jgi:polysaccharide transporter, PST family
MRAGLGGLGRVELVKSGTHRTGQVVDLIDYDVQRKCHVQALYLDIRMAAKMRNVLFGTAKEVIGAQYFMARGNQAVAQMGAEKGRPAGNEDFVHRKSSNMQSHREMYSSLFGGALSIAPMRILFLVEKLDPMSNVLLDHLPPGLRRILGNTGWLLADRVVRMALGLVVGVWIARYLGPSQFGELSFALSFVALFGTLTTLGLDGVVVRNIIGASDEALQILGTAFALRLCGSVLATILAIACIRLLQPNEVTAFWLVGLLSIGFLFQAFDTIDSYFQSQVQSRLTVWAKSSAFMTVAGIRLLLIHARAPLWAFAVAQVTELALGALAMTIAYRSAGGRLSAWQVQKWRAVQLLKQCWPVMLSGMAIMIYMRIDMVMLKVMQGAHAVGIYATATRISEIWYFVPMAIVSSVSPAIIREKANPRVYYGRIAKLFSLMALTGCIAGAAIALGAKSIIHVLYSDAFSAAAPVLAVHVWASIFVFLGVAQDPWNVCENLLKLGFYRTLAGAVINILLNVILIPRYSVMGAAIATVVSYAIAGVFANAFDVRTRPILILQLQSLAPRRLRALLNPRDD